MKSFEPEDFCLKGVLNCEFNFLSNYMSFSMIYFISGKFVLCEKRIHSKFSISVSRVVHCVPLSFSLWLHILLVVFPQRVI